MLAFTFWTVGLKEKVIFNLHTHTHVCEDDEAAYVDLSHFRWHQEDSEEVCVFILMTDSLVFMHVTIRFGACLRP